MSNIPNVTEAAIARLIGSNAYQLPSHPEYPRVRQQVSEWYKARYGHETAQADAAGKTIKPADKSVTAFISPVQRGETLLVGEGNLSFAKSLSEMPGINPVKIVATTYEGEKDLSDSAKENARILKRNGMTVLHDIDAKKLDQSFRSHSFKTIVFQFPNVGSREPIEGHNPNFILIRDFLKSSAKCLRPGGKVLISAVDSPHYEGAFQFEEAAERTGFETPQMQPFDPDKFPGYSHVNTNDEESSIEDHRKFATWIFAPKDQEKSHASEPSQK